MGYQIKVGFASRVLLRGLQPCRKVALEDRGRYRLVRAPASAKELIRDLTYLALRLGHLSGGVHSCLALKGHRVLRWQASWANLLV